MTKVVGCCPLQVTRTGRRPSASTIHSSSSSRRSALHPTGFATTPARSRKGSHGNERCDAFVQAPPRRGHEARAHAGATMQLPTLAEADEQSIHAMCARYEATRQTLGMSSGTPLPMILTGGRTHRDCSDVWRPRPQPHAVRPAQSSPRRPSGSSQIPAPGPRSAPHPAGTARARSREGAGHPVARRPGCPTRRRRSPLHGVQQAQTCPECGSADYAIRGRTPTRIASMLRFARTCAGAADIPKSICTGTMTEATRVGHSILG